MTGKWGRFTFTASSNPLFMNKTSLTLATIALSSALQMGSIVAATYVDDFNRANTEPANNGTIPNPIGTQYTIQRGIWAIDNNELSQSHGDDAQMVLNTITLPTLGEYSGGASFSVSIDFHSSSIVPGVIFNAQNEDNFYSINYHSGIGNKKIYFFGRASGSGFSEDLQTGVELDSDTMYTLLVTSNAAYTFHWSITATGHTGYSGDYTYSGPNLFTGGNAGIGISNPSIYDNFSVTTEVIPEPATWVSLVGGLGAVFLVRRVRRKA